MTRTRLGVLAAVIAALTFVPRVTHADEVTFKVPVQVSNLEAFVHEGKVACAVHGLLWNGVDPKNPAGGGLFREAGEGWWASWPFTIQNGAYSGTVTVAVQVDGPPQEWVKQGWSIHVSRPARYCCYLQLRAGISWEPEPKLDPITAQPIGFRSTPLYWSVPPSGLVSVQGTLQVTTQPLISVPGRAR
jgi:hypothetical protein